jgi:hypothetical protein
MTTGLIGIPVTHIRRGYGSAIFIELGELKPGRLLRNGTLGNPRGPFGLKIEWSWRVGSGISSSVPERFKAEATE